VGGAAAASFADVAEADWGAAHHRWSRMCQRLICVGAGRDGTLSITEMIQQLLDRAGGGRRVMHEYRAREFYQAFCNLQETKEPRFLDEIRAMIDECPYDCIVGNGYAAVLPQFAELWGNSATLVHIQRADRTAAINSLRVNCENFPRAYGYYAMGARAITKRMAAFHFGEMTLPQWQKLTLVEKLSWYYDKTHALVASYRDMFAASFAIATESIDEEHTRRLFARLTVGSDAELPEPVHLNAHRIDVAKFAANNRDKMQWLFGRLDFQRLANDDTFAIEYFLEKFVAWTGYQITGEIKEMSPFEVRSKDELYASLDFAERMVSDRLKDIKSLRRMAKRMT
jgi:hypothetical protein